MSLLTAFAVTFVCGFLADVFWVFYIRAANQGRAGRAALANGVIGGLGLLGIYSLVGVSWWTGIPYLAGDIAGSYVGVLLAKKLEDDDGQECACCYCRSVRQREDGQEAVPQGPPRQAEARPVGEGDVEDNDMGQEVCP